MIKTIYVGIFFIQEDVVAAAEGLASKARLCKKVSLVGRYGWFGSDGQVHFCTEVQEEDYE